MKIGVQLGIAKSVFVDGFKLLLDSSFTNNIDEQAHGAAATLHRYHQQCGYDVLAHRSTLNSLLPLLLPSPFQRKLAALERRLDLIDHRQPSKIGGRQMLFRELTNKRKARGFDDEEYIFAAMQPEMINHGKEWDQLNLQERGRYEEQAHEHRHAVSTQLKEARGALEKAISDLKRQHDAEFAEKGVPNHLGRCEPVT